MTLPNRGRILSRPEQEGDAAPSPNGPDLPAADGGAGDDVIAARAYEKWVRKGRPPGTALQDWLEAEAELKEIGRLAQRLAEANASLQASLAQSLHREEALRQA